MIIRSSDHPIDLIPGILSFFKKIMNRERIEAIRESITDEVTFEIIENPYMLPCGHTFSKSTLDNILNTIEPIQREGVGNFTGTCPKCRTAFTQHTMQKNFGMQETIDSCKFILEFLERQNNEEIKESYQSENAIVSHPNEENKDNVVENLNSISSALPQQSVGQEASRILLSEELPQREAYHEGEIDFSFSNFDGDEGNFLNDFLPSARHDVDHLRQGNWISWYSNGSIVDKSHVEEVD